MTAKRFKIVDIEEELYPMPIYYDRDKELSYDEVCNLLNELHEEKEQLKLLNNYLTELLKDLNGVSIEIEKVVE